MENTPRYVKSLLVDQAFFLPNLQARNIYEYFEEMIEIFLTDQPVGHDERQILVNRFMQREKMMTTYIGKGVAVPHICYQSDSVVSAKIGWFRSIRGISTGTKKQQMIHIFFCLIAPKDVLMMKLCVIGLKLLGTGDLKNALLQAGSAEEMKKLVDQRIHMLFL